MRWWYKRKREIQRGQRDLKIVSERHLKPIADQPTAAHSTLVLRPCLFGLFQGIVVRFLREPELIETRAEPSFLLLSQPGLVTGAFRATTTTLSPVKASAANRYPQSLFTNLFSASSRSAELIALEDTGPRTKPCLGKARARDFEVLSGVPRASPSL